MILFYSHYHKEELETTSSPNSSPSPILLPSDLTMLSLGQDLSANFSTASPLHTERESLATQSLDPSLASGLTHTPLRVVSHDGSSETLVLSKSRPHELPINDSIVDTNIAKADTISSPSQLQENTSLSRHSCCALGVSEHVATVTVTEEVDANRNLSTLGRESPLDSLQADVIDPSSLQTSCSIRRQRFAEHKSKVTLLEPATKLCNET